ncbi:uncharacterized protein rab11fip5a isoform X2 [Notothenia coriiceps]|uniref:Uncharacterized protein rab11fip5a isoform X2 n=1 Tax=Notothenia coriiceps TaxID=8208 RepID=A0A6I9NAL9_9TELE|nr:PREDICTED: uncharacterized protein LOC104949068 isoform X2 [Notothenia coriiceps]
MSSLTVEEDQKWLPTHVQVTVLRGRGLRGKGKHGTSDVYTIIQLAKEKYSTGVAEKTTEPEWREECSFELQPGVLQGGGRNGGCPAGATELVLIVMHRAHMGMDVFLGQVVIQLDKVFHESRCVKNEWYKLNSKSGKKEKERGEIQATVQFTRNNLTASMYDLVMTDKTASTFGKLKERIKGKRRSSEEDSSSAVLPSGYGSLHRMRQRLPSDGGGEEDYEDDEGGEARRSKMRTFFLRGKLRKSSDTRSSTSLGSESSESSRGGSLSPTAGISMVVSDLSNSPSNSSNLSPDNSPEHTANSLQCEFGDDPGEISIIVPPLPTAWVNGGDTYSDLPLDKGSVNPVDSLGLPPLQKSLPLSVSLQNLRPASAAPKSPMGDGRRWSFDKPDEEEKAAIAAALEKSGPMLGDEEEEEEEEGLGYAAQIKSSSSTVESGKKQRRNFFSHGRGESAGKGQSRGKDESEQAPAAEEKHKGWFGSKDSNSKPSLVVSPKLETSTDPHPPPLPPSHPPGPPVDPLVSLHHTNPFSQSTSPPMSPCNPFLSFIQQNPFHGTMLNAEPLKPSLPTLPYLSSARPPIAQFFPQASNPYPTLNDENPTAEDAKKRPLPPPPTYEEKPFSVKSSDHFMSAGAPEPEWDESFEAFAAGRLQSPEDLTADCKTEQNTPSEHSLEHCNEKAALQPITDQNTNVNDAVHTQPCTEFVFDTQKSNAYHLDTFAHSLETIPEHTSFENDNDTLAPLSPVIPHQQPAGDTESEDASSFSNLLTELHTKSDISSQPNKEKGKDVGEMNTSVEDFSKLLNDSSISEINTTDVTSPDDKLYSTQPSLRIRTSSPDVRHGSSGSPIESTGLGGQDASQRPVVPFGLFDDFFNTSPSQDFDDTMVHTPASDQSTSSFLQSLYVSTNSQDYQTCGSQPSSSGSEQNETRHSANSTLCGDLIEIQTTPEAALDQKDSRSQPFHEEFDVIGGSFFGAKDTTPTLKPSFTIEDNFGLLSAASTDLYKSYNPWNLDDEAVEYQHVVLGDMFSKSPQAQSTTLPRSHSEGTLTPAFEDLLQPSYGSDPGAIQASSSAPPLSPDLPSLTSFAPSLTPSSSISFSLPFLYNATARSPPSTAMLEEMHRQQQAANQQISPHPVKPLTTTTSAEEKRTEGRSVLATGLEKLKSSISPGRSSQLSEQETSKKKPVSEGAGSYFHLNHSELVALLVQREDELERQEDEFKRQKRLLAKREVELKKLKPQVKDLEDYIDTLLVRIMEQKPTLLQVRSKLK